MWSVSIVFGSYTSSRRKKKADRAGCQELCPASRHRWGLAKTWQQEGLRIIFSFNINSGHIKENLGSKNKGVKCLTHPQNKVRGSWAFWKELEGQETRSTLWSAPRHMWQLTTLGRLEYQSSLKKTAWIPPSLPSWIADKTVALLQDVYLQLLRVECKQTSCNKLLGGFPLHIQSSAVLQQVLSSAAQRLSHCENMQN